MRAAGFVLVGGMSTRMGQDKALLPWHSQFLVETIAATVAATTGRVTLVGRPERYAGLHLPCIPDNRDRHGPLGGVEAALGSGKAEWNLIVGCDMPGITDAVLFSLLEQAGRTTAPCVAAQDATGQIHPLCAVYHRRCLPTVRRSLEEGRLKLMKVLEDLSAEYLPLSISLANINTPEDWRRWQVSSQ